MATEAERSEHTARIEAARAGDAAALEELLRESRAQVVRYAMRLCISDADAEDATQETLLALAKYIGALREVAALSSWLFAAVRTHCTRLARRSLRHVLIDDGAPLAIEGPSPEEQLVDHQLRARLAIILSEIEPELRDAIVRRDIVGESGEAAAAALGLTVDGMKSRLRRARKEVKARLLASLETAPPRETAQKTSFLRRRSISKILRPG